MVSYIREEKYFDALLLQHLFWELILLPSLRLYGQVSPEVGVTIFVLSVG